MTAVAYAYSYFATPAALTAGSSDTAYYVSEIARNIRAHVQSSIFLGLQASGILDELDQVAEECKDPGWDGYGALPVSKYTIGYAHHFLLALPLGIVKPTVGSEPDGCITFEWYKSPEKICSISISQDGFIHYAYLNRLVKRHGSEPFSGSVPMEIVMLINQIVGK